MVEDNKMNQRVQGRMLSLKGISFETAENGQIAVQMFEEHQTQKRPYKLILMDFHMPEMDGREASRLIRKLEVENNYEHTHIVGLTAESGAKAPGMCHVVNKPIRKQTFNTIICGYLMNKGVIPCSPSEEHK